MGQKNLKRPEVQVKAEPLQIRRKTEIFPDLELLDIHEAARKQTHAINVCLAPGKFVVIIQDARYRDI